MKIISNSSSVVYSTSLKIRYLLHNNKKNKKITNVKPGKFLIGQKGIIEQLENNLK